MSELKRRQFLAKELTAVCCAECGGKIIRNLETRWLSCTECEMFIDDEQRHAFMEDKYGAPS